MGSSAFPKRAPALRLVFTLKTVLMHSYSYLCMAANQKSGVFYTENATYAYLCIVMHGIGVEEMPLVAWY